MNNEKVYIEGYVVGFMADATGTREKRIQVSSGEIVSIDEVFTHKLVALEKVKVPQFIADWIEYCKVKKITLAHALYHSEEAINKSVYRWIVEGSGHQETFALAWIFGYEVEKEKRYLVKVKAMNHINGCLAYNKSTENWFFGINGTSKNHRTHHTRKEIEEAGFGWVFDCPGIEIEEVE